MCKCVSHGKRMCFHIPRCAYHSFYRVLFQALATSMDTVLSVSNDVKGSQPNVFATSASNIHAALPELLLRSANTKVRARARLSSLSCLQSRSWDLLFVVCWPIGCDCIWQLGVWRSFSLCRCRQHARHLGSCSQSVSFLRLLVMQFMRLRVCLQFVNTTAGQSLTSEFSASEPLTHSVFVFPQSLVSSAFESMSPVYTTLQYAPGLFAGCALHFLCVN